MSKKVLIISTSLRKGGNSDTLADEFAKGAQEAAFEVERVSLFGKQINFCKGCLSCQKTQKCIINDDANAIVEKMIQSDVLVFATPVYFYQMCGQMKTLLDRANPAFPSDYKFKNIYLIATAAENELLAIQGTVNGLQGFIDCFENATLAGVINGIGVNDLGAVKSAPHLLAQAYQMGKSLT